METDAVDPAETGSSDTTVEEMAADGGETAMAEDEKAAEDDAVALEALATAAE